MKKISDSNNIKMPDRVLEDHDDKIFSQKIDDVSKTIMCEIQLLFFSMFDKCLFNKLLTLIFFLSFH